MARGRSYASILVIPRRKTRLCEALLGRRPGLELELHDRPWELLGEEGEGGGEGQGRGCWGRSGVGRAAR
jgi:hypothetical protein